MVMLLWRCDLMIAAGILDGDYVVVRQEAEPRKGDVVAAGIPAEEGPVQTWSRRGNKVGLLPANPAFEPIELDAADVRVYGKVVAVLRRL